MNGGGLVRVVEAQGPVRPARHKQVVLQGGGGDGVDGPPVGLVGECDGGGEGGGLVLFLRHLFTPKRLLAPYPSHLVEDGSELDVAFEHPPRLGAQIEAPPLGETVCGYSFKAHACGADKLALVEDRPVCERHSDPG
eukprot:CAMPEP_0114140414 /NCGR_PEP_ID=MMETSP0043_2-20121206/17369_1 /TAXON_ID=464988 /ORGANISM="Hemiselmis andersenii, Strain CCMP644" /LENGTH=136 /DNA_ID=CAMNT_0001234501 /DNA_START=203 /DNA_END=613 /DNA_ORIENTATION=-